MLSGISSIFHMKRIFSSTRIWEPCIRSVHHWHSNISCAFLDVGDTSGVIICKSTYGPNVILIPLVLLFLQLVHFLESPSLWERCKFYSYATLSEENFSLLKDILSLIVLVNLISGHYRDFKDFKNVIFLLISLFSYIIFFHDFNITC